MKYYVYMYKVDEDVIYIGLTDDITRRVREHASGDGLEKKFIPYLNDCKIYYHECGNEVEMRSLESLLINIYKPILNEVDKQSGDSTVTVNVIWVPYTDDDASEYYSIMEQIRDYRKNIKSNKTRIYKLWHMAEESNRRVQALTDFYHTLAEEKDAIVYLCASDEYIDWTGKPLPPPIDGIYIGEDLIEKWCENVFVSHGRCYIKFTTEFMRAFFAVSARQNWIETSLDAAGRTDIKECRERIDNLTRKNTELESKIDTLMKRITPSKR